MSAARTDALGRDNTFRPSCPGTAGAGSCSERISLSGNGRDFVCSRAEPTSGTWQQAKRSFFGPAAGLSQPGIERFKVDQMEPQGWSRGRRTAWLHRPWSFVATSGQNEFQPNLNSCHPLTALSRCGTRRRRGWIPGRTPFGPAPVARSAMSGPCQFFEVCRS